MNFFKKAFGIQNDETIIRSERLTLRPFRMGDLDDFYEYAKSRNVGPNAGWRPHENKDVSKRVLSRLVEEDNNFAIVENASGKMIGSIGLRPDRARDMEDVLKLGYSLNEKFWGKGYMTEAVMALLDYAFRELDVELISVDHFTFNERSKRVIEKCGFQFEGTLRYAGRLYDGRSLDLMLYSVSRDEFEARRDAQPDALPDLPAAPDGSDTVKTRCAIRDFAPRDLETFETMASLFYQTDAVTHPVSADHFQKTFALCMEKSPYVRGLMIEQDGQAAGFALLAFTCSNETGGLVVWIEELFILPEFQGSGLARAFFAFLDAEYGQTATRYRLEITKTNTKAAEIYKKYGFDTLDYLPMVKELPE